MRISKTLTSTLLAMAISCLFLAPLSAAPAPLGQADLSLIVDGKAVNLLSVTREAFEKKPGGSWQHDGDGMGGSTFSWANGQAHFDPAGMDQIFVKANARSPRGLETGLEANLNLYPKPDQVQDQGDSIIYAYAFTVGEDRWIFLAQVEKAYGTLIAIGISRGSSEQEEAQADPGDSGQPISYYDGFTWGGASPAEKLTLCTRIASAFEKLGDKRLAGKAAELVKAVDAAYTKEGWDYNEWVITIIAKKYRITDAKMIEKAKGM